MRNLADAIVVYEQQYKLRYEVKEMPPLQILADARHVLSVLKDKVKFTVGKCLRKHPALLSSSESSSSVSCSFGKGRFRTPFVAKPRGAAFCA